MRIGKILLSLLPLLLSMTIQADIMTPTRAVASPVLISGFNRYPGTSFYLLDEGGSPGSKQIKFSKITQDTLALSGAGSLYFQQFVSWNPELGKLKTDTPYKSVVKGVEVDNWASILKNQTSSISGSPFPGFVSVTDEYAVRQSKSPSPGHPADYRLDLVKCTYVNKDFTITVTRGFKLIPTYIQKNLPERYWSDDFSLPDYSGLVAYARRQAGHQVVVANPIGSLIGNIKSKLTRKTPTPNSIPEPPPEPDINNNVSRARSPFGKATRHSVGDLYPNWLIDRGKDLPRSQTVAYSDGRHWWEKTTSLFYLFRSRLHFLLYLMALVLSILLEYIVLIYLFQPLVQSPTLKATDYLHLFLACVTGTAITLTLIWSIFSVFPLSRFAYVLLSEGFALFAEAVVYYIFLRISFRNAIFLSAAANLVSYGVGLLLFKFFFSFGSLLFLGSQL